MGSRSLAVGLVLGAAGALGGQAALDKFHQTDADLETAYLQGYAKAAEVDAPKERYADVDQCFAFARAAHGFDTLEYHAYGNGCERGLTGEPPTPTLYIEVNRGD
jgi:hypothetical protein